MRCCSSNKDPVNIEQETVTTSEPTDDSSQACRMCANGSRKVPRRTLFLMLKPECFESVSDAQYAFCLNEDCHVVYFAIGRKSVFTIDDLRIRVGLKERQDPVPLCYCFGFVEADICNEFAKSGRITAQERITALIREGLCACAERNPAGVCCLPEVNKFIRKIYQDQE